MRITRSGNIACALTVALSTLATGEVHAETYEECLAHAAQSATETTTVGELRVLCKERLEYNASESVQATEHAAATAANAKGALEKRIALERFSHDNPFVLTPHRPNYLLPVVYTTNPDNTSLGPNEHLQHTEVQFQLSLKVLVAQNLIGHNGFLFFAYTSHSFWQAYNREVSAPFRETDHEPELLLSFENNWQFGQVRNSVNQIILDHQSNGRGGEFSRSWNRLMLNSIWEHDNFVIALMPWYRIPERKKTSPDDATGDDNPDIEKYMGNFELRGVYQVEHGQTMTLMLRNNLRSDNKGAVELSYSFPIGDTKLKGYLKYFNGYGESLIDYNHHIQSLGLGLLISDWL